MKGKTCRFGFLISGESNHRLITVAHIVDCAQVWSNWHKFLCGKAGDGRVYLFALEG